MKKTRLLEIIREEISAALREDENLDNIAKNKKQEYIKAAQNALNAEKAETAKSGALEEDQLNEIEQLAEMASMVQLKGQLEKQGRMDDLEAVKAAEQATIDKLKDNPEFSGEGKNIRLKGYVKNLKKELKDSHGIDLQTLLSQVAAQAEEAGEDFKDDIATNTIEKNAAAQVLGTEKSKPGPKADPNKPKKEKPESTGKRGRPAGSGEKKAVRTPGDDGFDNISYVDKEEAKAAAAAEKADKALGGKYAANLSSEDESKYEAYKSDITDLVSDLENKYDKLKMEELKLYLEDSEVRRLFKAKGVKLSDLVRSVIK